MGEPLKDWLAVCIREFFDELQTKQLNIQQQRSAKKEVRLKGQALEYWLRELYAAELQRSLSPFAKLESACARDMKHLSAILARADRYQRKRQQGNAARPALLSLSANIYDFCISTDVRRQKPITIAQFSKLFVFAEYIFAIVGHRCDARTVRERLRRAVRSKTVREARSPAIRALFFRLQGKRLNLDASACGSEHRRVISPRI